MSDPRGIGDSLALADLARWRQQTYQLISQALRYPDDERRRTVAAMARDSGAVDAEFARFLPAVDWGGLLRVASAVASQPPREGGARYLALFEVGAPTVPCPSYESAYRDGDDEAARSLAGVRRCYAAAGLELSPAAVEPIDHVAVEFEFMALLCDREALAWQRTGDPQGSEAATDVLGHQAGFLEQHLHNWLPEFAARLAAEERGGVYASLAQAMLAFVIHDRDLVSALNGLADAASG